MRSLHWQMALSDSVITFPGLALQFVLVSFCQEFYWFSLRNSNINIKRAFSERTFKSGEDTKVVKKGRVSSSFSLNVISTGLQVLQISLVNKIWTNISSICLLYNPRSTGPWYAVPNSSTCFSRALLPLTKSRNIFRLVHLLVWRLTAG